MTENINVCQIDTDRENGSYIEQHTMNIVDISDRLLGISRPDQYSDTWLFPVYLPQVVEINTPRSLDATGECLLYDEFRPCAGLLAHQFQILQPVGITQKEKSHAYLDYRNFTSTLAARILRPERGRWLSAHWQRCSRLACHRGDTRCIKSVGNRVDSRFGEKRKGNLSGRPSINNTRKEISNVIHRRDCSNRTVFNWLLEIKPAT